MECCLLDNIEIIGGGTPKTTVPEYWNGDVPWISIKDFNNDSRYVYETEKNITQVGLENSSAKLLQRDDIIISARGTIGKLAMIPYPMAFNQSCYGIRPKQGINNTYLYYLLKNSVNELKSISHGSVFDTITGDTFASISVNIPNEQVQIAIATVLGLIDDKIAINKAINKNLEATAQAIFSNCFSSRLEPKIPISTLIDVRDGTHDSPKVQNSGCYLITSKHLQPYSVTKQEAKFIKYEDFMKINERSKVEYGDILISMIGTVGVISYVSDYKVDYAIKNVGLFRTSQTKKLRFYVLNYLKSAEIKKYIRQRLAGSTQEYISLTELRNIPICFPKELELEKFNSLVFPIYSKIFAVYKENAQLTAIRDTLLPKLMSGEIDVSQVKI